MQVIIRLKKLLFWQLVIMLFFCYGYATAAVDDSYTKYLLHFEGDFTDENGKAWTGYDGAIATTTQAKFGSYSLYLDGTSDYLDTAADADLVFDADYTIDFWFWWTGGSDVLISNLDTTNDGNQFVCGVAATWYFDDGSSTKSRYQLPPSTDNWHHVAMVRSGDAFSLYIDGISTSTSTGTYAIGSIGDATKPLYIGRNWFGSASEYYQGYIDELRISKGIARWTADFTPPTSPYGPPEVPPIGGIIQFANSGMIQFSGSGGIDFK